MQFLRLRLNGFKSFVDQTDLVIQPGLTGVVGPNGCGKSNLLEALRWVMGENRPTAMRGGEMEDVIFAGTDSRGARHFAEVTLQIDNSDRVAPAGFNDADALDVIRRITRDAGSAYKINGKDVRARDVQMLFADASTGAHSPALVRQGQIAELISAKPKARRRILEEAAGISGLYQRRHEAELRLRATESNLERLTDILDQMAAQLAQLARQARQAERYREIGTRLRQVEGQALYRRWQEADTARLAAEQALQAAFQGAGLAELAARDALRARERAEDSLPPLRDEEAIAGAVLQRLLVARDALSGDEARAQDLIRTLHARVSQLGADIERETALNRDAADMIAQLDWEAAQLAKASEGHDARLAAANEAAALAHARLQEQEGHLSALTEDAARLAARHQSAQRAMQDHQANLDRLRSALSHAIAAGAEGAAALAQANDALEAARDNQDSTIALTEEAEETLALTEDARAEAQTLEADARGALAEAEGETGTLRAEVAALSRLLAKDRSDTAQMLDLIRVTPGLEAALGAALGDDLRAPVTRDGSGWHPLPDYANAPSLPTGAAPLAPHVQGPDALARRLSQVGVIDAADGPRLHATLQPGQRLVTRAGDLWRWDGLVTTGKDAPSAAALRLQQVNRLEALREGLADAETRLDAAQTTHAAHKARLDALTAAERQARDARRMADQRLTEAGRAFARTEAARDAAQARIEQNAALVARLEHDLEQARDALEDAAAQLADLPALEDARGQVDAQRADVDAARQAMMTARAQADDLRREATARLSRLQEVTKSLSGWKHRLSTAEARIADLTDRQEAAQEQLSEANAAPDALAAQRARLSEEITAAETRNTAARDALAAAEGALRAALYSERQAERSAADAREGRARADARMDAAREGLALAAARIREAMECSPDDLRAQLDVDPATLPDVAALDDEAARLRRARDALGAVNLRAAEDARTLQTESDTLTQEKADLEAAVAKLRAGITALNREGRERLLVAFDKVNANFATLFTHLFTGGEARLVLVESDDPLDAGLEIMCQPPGKKLSTLSLLSGGEQTLTAMALIFAVFLANPAPICVLDEVDAPLDDANVARFCDLLDEMTRRAETRFLIITHNALTMARMDRLFGVTMAERGVSQLVSVDLKEAETLVA
ncbi:MAG: AAA family ATPase [Roseinatronobacter sp.]